MAGLTNGVHSWNANNLPWRHWTDL